MHRGTDATGGRGMILRLFQVVTRLGKEEAFGTYVRETAMSLMKSIDGIVQVPPGFPHPESPREFGFVMVWKDQEALKAFAGGDCRNPLIDPAEAEVVESRSIEHHDLVAG